MRTIQLSLAAILPVVALTSTICSAEESRFVHLEIGDLPIIISAPQLIHGIDPWVRRQCSIRGVLQGLERQYANHATCHVRIRTASEHFEGGRAPEY